jgi:hypothetical protein
MRSALLFLLFLSACSHSQVEPTTAPAVKKLDDAPIQGTWEVQIPGGPMGGGIIQWRFEHGVYTLTGYPALSGTGKYKVARADGVNLSLEFSEQTGDMSQFNTMEIVVDQSAQTLMLKGQGPYHKIKP